MSNNVENINIEIPESTPSMYVGMRGQKGDTGATPDLTIGTVTTGAAGSSASATITGTKEAPVLNLTIPKGDEGDKGDKGEIGDTPELSIGTVSTGAAGSSASVTISGTTAAPVLNFTIPKGDKGDSGNTDVTASAYSSSKTYAVGDYVIYNNNLYRCTTAITTAEAWTSGHWTQVAIANDVTDLKAETNAKIDKFTDVSFSIANKRVYRDGEIDTSNGDKITDYYPCKAGTTVEWYGRTFYYQNVVAMNAVAFYDESKNFISGVSQVDGSTATTNQIGKITAVAPANTAYVVGSDHTTSGVTAYLHVFDVEDVIIKAKEELPKIGEKLDKFVNVPFNVANKRYDYNTKAITTSNGQHMTEYYPCKEGDVIKYSGKSFFYQNAPAMYCVAFLDASQNFISGKIQVDGSSSTVTTAGVINTTAPKGTAFVVCSLNGSPANEQYYVHIYAYDKLFTYDYNRKLQNDSIIQKEKNARHIKGTPSVSPLSILHFSDLHADATALGRIMSDRAYIGAYINDAICTGDMVANTAQQISSWWDSSVMTCIGNHDTASYSGGVYDWTALSMADRDAYYIAPFESNWGITHTSGTSYYYKDYATQKVRLIVMDVMLYNDNGEEATAQTAWLSSLLSDAITNEYHVLIAIHTPHGGAVSKSCSFSKYGQSTMPTRDDCNTPQAVIDAVSSAISNGLHFVGYLAGHTHQDNIWDAESDGTQLMYCITCANTDTKVQWRGSDQFRDKTLDAYNIVTIDTEHTLVKIIRGGGADIDDHMRTRKAICFDYSTGEIVGEVL